jgi:beta-glucosidase
MIKFPSKFLWGAATSAYQVEGGNSNSDWWAWEGKMGLTGSGEACHHYRKFNEDFDLAKELGHNCHRLSVEWARIEPEEGRFSQQELEHYRSVISALKNRGIEPIVTLHHFTNPLWFAERGDWQNKNAVKLFLRYAEKVVRTLGDGVNIWATINEPTVHVYYSYVFGTWPPGEKSIFKAWGVMRRLLSAHVKAYRMIHRVYKELGLKPPMVGFAHNMQDYVPCENNLRNRIACSIRNKLFNLDIIHSLVAKKAMDFIGVNYYSRSLVELKGWGPRNFIVDVCEKRHSTLKKNAMGWDVYPQGIKNIILGLRMFKLPILILENGICTPDDGLRWDFIRDHLLQIHEAINLGADVIGYIYWSLLDNFEWDKGFGPRFGLIEIDYLTYQRRVRESARKFADVCKTNRL